MLVRHPDQRRRRHRRGGDSEHDESEREKGSDQFMRVGHGSLQGIEVGRDVPGLLLAYPELGHCRRGAKVLGMLDPLHELLRMVGKTPGQIGSAREVFEGRPDAGVGAGDSWNCVASAASAAAESEFPLLETTAGEALGVLPLLSVATRNQQQADEGECGRQTL